MGKWEHRLVEKNVDEMTGVCSSCGPVALAKKTSKGSVSYRCGVARDKQRDSPNANRHAFDFSPEQRAKSKANAEKKRNDPVVRPDGSGHGVGRRDAREMCEGKTCAVDGCGRPAKALDHCHATKRIREPLCIRCNWMLGHAEDDADLLRGLGSYLDKHSAEAAA